MASSGADGQPSDTRKLLLLHGSRQTGQLLLSRMGKLRKKLLGVHVQLVAPDAPFPHPEDKNLRQWWTSRTGDHCAGLDESLQMLRELWQSERFEGIMGFSQGARMAHLMAVFANLENAFPCLQYVILVSGYDAPLPFLWKVDSLLDIPSLHVWGSSDKLITPQQSQSVMQYYRNSQHHEHQGGHHVPMRAANVEAYLNFIKESTSCSGSLQTTQPQFIMHSAPDDEATMAQLDEVEALSAIFPDQFTLLSKKIDNDSYHHPIRYRLALPESDIGTWPPHPMYLVVEYPFDYPGHSLATISFNHENNMMELSSGHIQLCLEAMKEAAEAEEGMPSVLSCVYAAREFFESGGMETAVAEVVTENEAAPEKETSAEATTIIQSVSPERIKECNLQGLEIARTLLRDNAIDTGKGGSWKYTIGLVGKPSAGKSTFFNAGTGFARQRDDADNALGGATMAPHPFTTIDPNVGFCLVPAPKGSCPEEEYDGDLGSIGCTHGRDSNGRRLLPVMLKDVAGLVPGAYQGRGRGNKFLNDLTDADVLIHVVDASGTADTEGNDVGIDGKSGARGSHPLSDLSWIRNELVEWVYANVMHKWDNIRRRGKSKLSDMFSGYGQSQAMVSAVLLAVEKWMDENEQRDHALDHLDEWNQGDVHRLVSTFLGVRFPMALALNKSDISSAAENVRDVQEALPIHGAHVGVPLSARNEMNFVKHHLQSNGQNTGTPPTGVWQCLQSSIMLRAPVLVFPVCDMSTYAPLPGMMEYATLDASLPSEGMISCLNAAGGCAPSLWSKNTRGYDLALARGSSKLRDCMVMKPGSTVDDVYISLKRMGALGGEFVRAEGAARIGEKAKLVPKHELVTRHNRILKIMTNKRNEWQTK